MLFRLSIVVRLLLTLVDQTLYPTFDLAGIESALHCGISLLKVEALGLEAIQADEALYDRMEAWMPPSLLDEESFTTALVNGAWATAYSRYLHWHNDLKGKPYATAPAHSRTSRARASREVVSVPLVLKFSKII